MRGRGGGEERANDCGGEGGHMMKRGVGGQVFVVERVDT